MGRKRDLQAEKSSKFAGGKSKHRQQDPKPWGAKKPNLNNKKKLNNNKNDSKSKFYSI
jgi:hypothetical protein